MITYAAAKELAGGLLRGAGMPAAAAGEAAEVIVLADAWGIGSHGLMRLPYYLQRIVGGGMAVDATPTCTVDTGPLVCYDGNTGLGHPQLLAAAELASQRCTDYGVAAVAVANSSHCGCLGVYTLPAIRRGHLGLVFSNGPAAMVPWGGHTPVLSTSPLAAGVPTTPVPTIVDMATTAVARGTVATYAKRNQPLPEGWAVDASGIPTTDPQAALTGMLAPLGGAKGFALALVVEALTGGLVGPALAGDVTDMFDTTRASAPQRIAHIVIALDPARLDPTGSSVQRLAELAARVAAAGGRLPGGQRPLPEHLDPHTPLEVAPSLLDELADWANRLRARS